METKPIPAQRTIIEPPPYLERADVVWNILHDAFGDSQISGAEIGVWMGWMSHHLLFHHPNIIHYLMIDRWASTPAGHRYRLAEPYDPRAFDCDEEMAVAMRTADERTAFAGERRRVWQIASIEAARQTPAASLDFIFLDADHSYDGLTEDLHGWVEAVRPGGLIIGHDIDNIPTVTQAVVDFMKGAGVSPDGLHRGDQSVWWFVKPERREPAMTPIKYNVDDLVGAIDPAIVAGRMGSFSLTERDMAALVWLFDRFKPQRVLEFGVCEGHTAAVLLASCPAVTEYVGIDLRPELFPARTIVPKQAGQLADGDPRFRAVLTDETIEDVHRQLGTRPVFDAIILDANHTAKGTARDTEGTDALLVSGGLRVWHDYDVGSRQDKRVTMFGVKAYVDQLVASGRKIYVPDDEPRDPWKCCSLAWEVKR